MRGVGALQLVDRFVDRQTKALHCGRPLMARDHVENGHASTSLSRTDGRARAYALTGQQRHVVAVIGDGALTGGMAWEARNNIAAGRDRNVVIVRRWSCRAGGRGASEQDPRQSAFSVVRRKGVRRREPAAAVE
jgi:transketolase N-terminal domain/subunit